MRCQNSIAIDNNTLWMIANFPRGQAVKCFITQCCSDMIMDEVTKVQDGGTPQTLKNAVFWDVEPCGLIINRRFGGTCRLRLQGRRNS
jgi:hypothetical protein